jgi:hypothetical protein
MIKNLRSFYKDKLHKQLEQIHELKLDLSKKKKICFQCEKKSRKIESNNRNIVEPFAIAKEELIYVNNQVTVFSNEKMKLEQIRVDLQSDQSKLQDLRWQHEVMVQKLELLANETDVSWSKLQMFLLKVMLNRGNQIADHLSPYKHLEELHALGLRLASLLNELMQQFQCVISNTMNDLSVELLNEEEVPSIDKLRRLQNYFEQTAFIPCNS